MLLLAFSPLMSGFSAKTMNGIFGKKISDNTVF